MRLRVSCSALLPALLVGLAPALARAQAAQPPGDDQDQGPPQPATRAEPTVVAPADPLDMSPEVKESIGSDVVEMPPPAQGDIKRGLKPWYEEARGDYRLRTLPPFWLEHTRGVGTAEGPDRQSLYGLLYYQRRSKRRDADVLFPLGFRFRDDDDSTLAVGPFVHRESPVRHDNWLAPLVFEGRIKNGGYYHMPLLLETSHWSPEGAFTLWGPYFRDRSGTEVNAGLVPFWFHGDNGNEDARKTYTLVPPLAFYHRTDGLAESSLTVAGPFIHDADPKRTAFDLAPVFFHVWGHPETGGVRESHTTVFPVFHYGHTDDRSLLWVPGYLRRVTPDTDTLISPFYSHALTRSGESAFRVGGPVLPLVYDYRDARVDAHAWAIAPLYYQSRSRRGFDVMTPLFASFRDYGVSHTTWVLPSLVHHTDAFGWETDFHPIVYFGRSVNDHHSVLAPLYWDFGGTKYRSTVAFPFVWRFANDGNVTQVAVNTVYIERAVKGGADWQFHFAPLFSYGQSPTGYFWNFLFGLAGYERQGEVAKVKALWLPIQVAGPSGPPAAAPKQAAGR